VSIYRLIDPHIAPNQGKPDIILHIHRIPDPEKPQIPASGFSGCISINNQTLHDGRYDVKICFDF